MSQASLFDIEPAGRVRHSDPTTSVDAARTCNAASQRGQFYRELVDHPDGLTADELQTITGVPRYIVATRLSQMRKAGECERWGERENAAGRNVQVWYAVRETTVRVTGDRL